MDNRVTLLPAWREAVQQLLSKTPEPGYIIERKWLVENFNLHEPTRVEDFKEFNLAFLNSFDRFRKELLENYKIDLKPLIGRGYEIIHPRDQTKHALITRTKNIVREIQNMSRSIVNVNTTRLTDSERKEHADGAAKAATISGMINRKKILGR